MKKILAGLLLCVSTLVYCETWTPVSQSIDGILLNADIDSLEFVMMEDVGVVVFGIMKYTGKEYLPPFGSAISVKECIEQGGGELVNIFVDKTTQKQRWAIDGKAMFDAQGQFLCGFSKEVLRTRQAPAPKDVKPGRKYFT